MMLPHAGVSRRTSCPPNCTSDPRVARRGRIAGPAKEGGRLLHAFSVVVARIGFSATTSRESRQGRKAAAAAMMSGAGVPAGTGRFHALRAGVPRGSARGRGGSEGSVRGRGAPKELRR